MVKYERYKGNDIIVLCRSETDKYPFSFGIAKAKLIVENYKAIVEFVEAEQRGGEDHDRQ